MSFAGPKEKDVSYDLRCALSEKVLREDGSSSILFVCFSETEALKAVIQ